jgi:hypothetical protein
MDLASWFTDPCPQSTGKDSLHSKSKQHARWSPKDYIEKFEVGVSGVGSNQIALWVDNCNKKD